MKKAASLAVLAVSLSTFLLFEAVSMAGTARSRAMDMERKDSIGMLSRFREPTNQD